MIIGYARTSTSDQKAGLEAQERDLRSAAVEKVFREQVSSVAQREALSACLEFLREGDILIVTKPDRLARSTAELLSIETDLSGRGVGLVVLSMGGQRLDTRNPTSKLMLTILAGVATWEREIMLERQREGEGGGQIQGTAADRPRKIRPSLEVGGPGHDPRENRCRGWYRYRERLPSPCRPGPARLKGGRNGTPPGLGQRETTEATEGTGCSNDTSQGSVDTRQAAAGSHLHCRRDRGVPVRIRCSAGCRWPVGSRKVLFASGCKLHIRTVQQPRITLGIDD